MTPARRPARSLADDLRARTDDELAALLVARPDLARPAPLDLTSLAARSTTRASTQRALERLDTAHLQVLETLLATGSPSDPALAARWLGAGTLGPVLTDLQTQALVWRTGATVTVSRTVAEMLGPRPGGLWPGLAVLAGAVPAALADDGRIDDVLATAPPAARRVLDLLTWSSGALALDAGTLADPAVGWLIDQQLLVRHGEGQAVLPREVALRLRGGLLLEHPALAPPAVDETLRGGAVVDLAGGGAAGALLAQVDEVLATWGADPPRVLRSGGLAVRDLARLGAVLDVGADHAALVAEVMLAAGLLADDGALEPSWLPTPAADEWSARPAAQRWAELAAAWLTSPRAPHLVGTAGPHGTVNALGADASWPPVRELRRDVLEVLASRPPGNALAPAAIQALLVWRRPLRRVDDLAGVVSALTTEAERLGVTGRGALTGAGRALLEPGPDDVVTGAAEAVEAHLPPAVAEILLQADLTAVAPGRVEGPLAALLRLAADVESRGGATVHRFTDASVRRALDAGWTGEDLLAALAGASATPVPQPLAYLVQDVSRRHGRLRVGSAAAYVRGEDPVELDAILATPALAPLRLRRIAPTVLVSPLGGDVVLAALRAQGLAPAAETEDGVVSVPAASRRTSARRRPGASPLTAVVDDDLARTVVASMRTGQEAADHGAGGGGAAASDPAVVLALLREAVADQHPVRVDYAAADGGTTRMLLHPRRVDGGRVYGTAGTSNVERVLSVHRIISATPG